ncbi:membrane-associated transporter protein-like [Diadema antillarum]|uniref:membrane-associated transporter protein-like n=1 Tax=Diadema antillarum TaxID=105358 RepID=UPI003A877DEA
MDTFIKCGSARRRSSFPSVAVETENDEGETQMLCSNNILSKTAGMKHFAKSTGLLPTSTPSENFPSRLLAPSHHVPMGSMLNIASEKLAGAQSKDWSLLPMQPPRKFLKLLQQSSVQFGMEFCYATEGALVTPILLQLGLPNHLYGLAWFLAPILSLIFAPLIGSSSDRCPSPWGRRRPFILVFSIGAVIGTGLYLYGGEIGDLIDSSATTWGIAITVIGVVLTDFAAQSCSTPFMAYLVDVCNADDLKRVLSMTCAMGGLGGGLGYICIAIDWEKTPVGRALGSQYQVIFLLNILAFAVPLILTLTSIPETPLGSSLSSSAPTPSTPSEAESTSEHRPLQETKTSNSRPKFGKKCTFLRGKKNRETKTKRTVDAKGSSGGLKGCFQKKSIFSSKSGCEAKNRDETEPLRTNPPDRTSESINGTTKRYEQLIPNIPNGICSSGDSSSVSPKWKVSNTKALDSRHPTPNSHLGSECVVKIQLTDQQESLHVKSFKIREGYENGRIPASRSEPLISQQDPIAEAVCTGTDDGVEGEEECSEEDSDKNSEPQSCVSLLHSVFCMPKQLVFLCITNFFGWAGMNIALVFYTDFVAQAVYNGDPSAPPDSEEYLRYEEGVQMGSWGLCIYAFFSSAVGLLMTFLQRHLSQKFLYVSCHLIFVAGCIAAVSLTKHIFIIFLLCLSAGPYQVVLMTVPYNILAQYHKCNKYKSPEEGLPRGLGTDMACLDSQSYLGQIAISAIMGPLIQLTGSHLTIIALSGLMSLIAALSAAFLVAYEIVEDGDSDTENENVA